MLDPMEPDTPTTPGCERYALRLRTPGGRDDHQLFMDVHTDRPAITEGYEWIGQVPTPTMEDIEEGREFTPPTYPPPVTWEFASDRDVLVWIAYQASAHAEYTMYGPDRVLPTNWGEVMPEAAPPAPEPETS